MHAKLQEAADGSGKSLNAEFIARLEQSFDDTAPAMATAVARLSILLNLTDAQKITEQLKSTIVATHLRQLGELLLPRLDPAEVQLIAEVKKMMSEASSAIHSPQMLQQESMKRIDEMRKSLEQLQSLSGAAEAGLDLNEFQEAILEMSETAGRKKILP